MTSTFLAIHTGVSRMTDSSLRQAELLRFLQGHH